LSFLYQHHGRADVDGANWNNGLPTHAPARWRRCWRWRVVCGAQAVGVASFLLGIKIAS
jgi:hypothetical protein